MTEPSGDVATETVVADLVDAAHLLEPDDLPELVRDSAARLGASEARIYLADYEQRELRQLVHPARPMGEPLLIDTTVAGRVYRTDETVEVRLDTVRHLWLPLIDGTHRIGVLELCLDADGGGTADRWRTFAGLVADITVTKSAYGDTAHVTRRRLPMALRAEAQRNLLPPLTFISPRVVVTGMLEPSYEVAGDTFDYAVNADTVHLAILDAMGHSLSATLTAAVAVSAYRNCRRGGAPLLDCWRAAEEAVATEFDGERFSTAVLAELDLGDGRLLSLSAGHPSALLVREGKVVGRVADQPTLPLGLGGDTPVVTETGLQPGDRLLLFTDGIVEARSQDGEFFGEGRLVDHLDREIRSGLPAPEAVRRLVGAVVDHQGGAPGDDATLLLVEWRGADKTRPHPAAV